MVVTILILIDGFLQYMNEPIKNSEYGSQSYLIDGFLQYRRNKTDSIAVYVTILILIDGFLQY